VGLREYYGTLQLDQFTKTSSATMIFFLNFFKSVVNRKELEPELKLEPEPEPIFFISAPGSATLGKTVTNGNCKAVAF
jgi:hypothetical protein